MSRHGGTTDTGSAVDGGELDVLLAACRALVAVSARSIAAVQDVVDVAQFRVLVVVAGSGSTSLGALADAAGLTLSTASRTCDRLVGLGLLHRADDPANRRQLLLTLTGAGEALVGRVMRTRRAGLEDVLRRMPKARRAELVDLLEEFATAAGEPTDRELWALGWS